MIATCLSRESAFAVSGSACAWIEQGRVIQTDGYGYDSLVADVFYKLCQASNLAPHIEDIDLRFEILTVDDMVCPGHSYRDILTSIQPVHPELTMTTNMTRSEVKGAITCAKRMYACDIGPALAMYCDLIHKLYGLVDFGKIIVRPAPISPGSDKPVQNAFLNLSDDLLYLVIAPERMSCFSGRHLEGMIDIQGMIEEWKHDERYKYHNLMHSWLLTKYPEGIRWDSFPVFNWEEYLKVYTEGVVTAVKFMIDSLMTESCPRSFGHTSHF